MYNQYGRPSNADPGGLQPGYQQLIFPPWYPQPSLGPPPQRSMPVVEDTLPVDFQLLLMSLADEYIAAARGMGPTVALLRHEEDLQRYFQLMATGMGCLDAVLRKYRQEPRVEASLRLRYASLLFEETNNDLEVEQQLSKGILLAERNRLLDLKYSMQYLLAKALFRTKPRAGLTSIDKIIPDVETLQHTAWVYAFRFLRASLSLQLHSQQDMLAALQHIRAITSLAERFGDMGIYITSAAFDAIVHLQMNGSDSVEQAQRALATARSYQLQVPSGEMMQVWALLDVVDLACSLQTHQNVDQVQAKMIAMQDLMDGNDDDRSSRAAWNSDGQFAVAITHNVDMRLIETTGGIFQSDSEGHTLLTFSWLSKRDLYMLGYYLSGVTTILTKSASDDKAMNYLKEGVKLTQTSIKSPSILTSNLADASNRLRWHANMQWYMQMQLAFIACQRADWKAARSFLKTLGKGRDDPAIDLRDDDIRWLHYLTAVVAQGCGDLDAALTIYQSAPFTLAVGKARQHVKTAQDDLCLLAALNTLLIIRTPSHPSSHIYHDILAKLEPICVHHPNKGIQSAFALLRSVAPRSNPTEPMIVKTKQHLQQALQLAKSTSNNQLLAISLNFMTALFFTNIVGEQAEKSARTGQHLAKRARSSLWISVADGQLAETLEKCGKRDEAAQIRMEAGKHVAALPPPLKQLCEQG